MNNFGNYTFFLTNNQVFCYFHCASWSKYTMPPPQKRPSFFVEIGWKNSCRKKQTAATMRQPCTVWGCKAVTPGVSTYSFQENKTCIAKIFVMASTFRI